MLYPKYPKEQKGLYRHSLINSDLKIRKTETQVNTYTNLKTLKKKTKNCYNPVTDSCDLTVPNFFL